MGEQERYQIICQALRKTATPAAHPHAAELCRILLRAAKKRLRRFDVEAEDLLHDLIVAKLPELLRADGLGYAVQTLKHRAIDERRRAARRLARDEKIRHLAARQPPAPSAEEQLARAERLHLAVLRLRPADKHLTQAILADEPRDELARTLGCTRNTLDRRISRLFVALRAQLEALERE